MVHTWSGVVFIIAGILHFAIHWRWVVNVTKKVFRVSAASGAEQSAPVVGNIHN